MLNLLKDAGSEGRTVDEWNEKAREVGLRNRATLYNARDALKRRGLVHERNGTWFYGQRVQPDLDLS